MINTSIRLNITFWLKMVIIKAWKQHGKILTVQEWVKNQDIQIRWQNKKYKTITNKLWRNIKINLWKCSFFHFIFKIIKLYYPLKIFFPLCNYLYVRTEGKWIRTPIFKMESSFSISEFRKLNYVTRPNTSSGKIKKEEEEEENKKYGNTFKNHYS